MVQALTILALILLPKINTQAAHLICLGDSLHGATYGFPKQSEWQNSHVQIAKNSLF